MLDVLGEQNIHFRSMLVQQESCIEFQVAAFKKL